MCLQQVEDQPLIHGLMLVNDHMHLLNHSQHPPASIYKHPCFYKRAANMAGLLYISFYNIRPFLFKQGSICSVPRSEKLLKLDQSLIKP